MLVDARLRNAFIKFESIDCTTDEGSALAEKHNIRHVPVVMVVDNEGNELQRYDNVADIMKAISTGVLKTR